MILYPRKVDRLRCSMYENWNIFVELKICQIKSTNIRDANIKGFTVYVLGRRSFFNCLDYKPTFTCFNHSLRKINFTFRHFFYCLFIFEPTQFFQSLLTKSLPILKIKLPSIFIFIYPTDQPKTFQSKIFVIQVIKEC